MFLFCLPVFAVEPQVTHVGLLAPDILGITIEEGRVIRGDIVSYTAQPGDVLVNDPPPTEQGDPRWVERDGQTIGVLVGKNYDLLRELDSFEGPRLSRVLIDQTSSYTLVALGEANVPAINVVYRKSSPTDMTNIYRSGSGDYSFRHTVYLKFASALPTDETYRIEFADALLDDYIFENDPRNTRSEAVHVVQTGFRACEVFKIAYLSCWVGNGPDGGGVDYSSVSSFEIIDNATGATVSTGSVALRKAKNQAEDNVSNGIGFDASGLFIYDDGHYNHSKVDVYKMNFRTFDTPGEYRVYVPGIGCSYPFELKDNVWEEPFRAVMQGYYHQRSGLELSVNGSEWTRPLCFHPDNGDSIYEVNVSVIDGVALEDLHNHMTGQTVPEAWGGYMDAGDWDRHSGHLICSYNLLDLIELFPAYFEELDLPIPECSEVLPDANYAGVELPDVVDEALWDLDMYRRMQLGSGAVRGGVESSEHPRKGEPSWLESMYMYAFAPDVWSSYKYAAVAAKASLLLKRYDTGLSALYLDSAEAAVAWAETQPVPSGKEDMVTKTRSWAAAELFRLTGDSQYHTIFLDATTLNPLDSGQMLDGDEFLPAYTYAITDRPGMDTDLKDHARARFKATLSTYYVAAVNKSAFRFLKHIWAPHGWGSGTQIGSNAENVMRAFVLGGNETFLYAGVQGTGIGLGANPKNLCYTTGLGDNPVTTPLHIDCYNGNKTVPTGIPIYGSILPRHGVDDWPVTWYLTGDQAIFPSYYNWPIMENQHGFWLWPPMNEYTVQQTFATNSYVWGFLAAMNSNDPPPEPDADSDDDGYYDSQDNCPATYNPSQTDCDGDGVGNACDDDCPYLDGQEPVTGADYAIFADDWQQTEPNLPGDLDGDNDIDIDDLETFADYWLSNCLE